MWKGVKVVCVQHADVVEAFQSQNQQRSQKVDSYLAFLN